MPGFEEHSIAVELDDEDMIMKSKRMSGVAETSPLGTASLVSASANNSK